MLEKNPIYRGLLMKPTIMFLPLIEFVAFISLSGLLFMWVHSIFIILPICVIYIVLLTASKWDQNFMTVFWITSKNIPSCRNSRFWGGHSYEP